MGLASFNAARKRRRLRAQKEQEELEKVEPVVNPEKAGKLTGKKKNPEIVAPPSQWPKKKQPDNPKSHWFILSDGSNVLGEVKAKKAQKELDK